MCGFAGELTSSGPADAGATERMASALSHRGPDGHGTWAAGRLSLSHRRLKIIDLSERAAQPLVDPQLGLVIAFNGCIYNFRQLRRELEDDGYAFFSRSDSEVQRPAGEAAIDEDEYSPAGEAFLDALPQLPGDCALGRERASGAGKTPKDSRHAARPKLSRASHWSAMKRRSKRSSVRLIQPR